MNNNNLENNDIPIQFTSSSPIKPSKPSQSYSKSSTIKLTRPSLSTLTSSISRNKSNTSSPIINTLSNQPITTTTTTINPNLSFSVGDRVKSTTNQMIGKCAFIGTIDQKIGLWVGIDLSYPLHDPGQSPWYGKGKNSGSVNGVSYFSCDPNCGIFFPISKVSAYPFPKSHSHSHSHSQSQQRIIFPPQPHSPIKPSTVNTNESDPSNRSTSPNRLSRSFKASLPNNQSHHHLSTPKPRPRISLHHNARKSIGNLFNNNRPISTATLPSSPNIITTTTTTNTTPNSTSSRILRNFSSSISKNSNSILNPISTDLIPTPIQSNRQIRSSFPESPSTKLNLLNSEDKPITEPILVISDELNQIKKSNDNPNERLIKEMNLNQTEIIEEEEILNQLSNERFKEIENRLKEVEVELRIVKEERDLAQEGLRLAKEESSLVIENQYKKSKEIEKQYKQTIEEKTKLIETFNQTETETKQEIEQMKLKFEEEKTSWREEREELIEELGSLRQAGQSLCSVYEEKMLEVESRRVEAVERYEKLIREGDHQENGTDFEKNRIERNEGHLSIEAIEIDNERLKADLKYNKERVGNLQDQVYELKQEIETETEKKEKIEEELRNTIERHRKMIKKIKEENLNQIKEKETLEMKLGQVEMRLKECVETMEKDRIELEGLRDELIVNQPTRTHQNTKLVIPTNTDDDEFSKKMRFRRTEETVRDQDDDDQEEDDGDRTRTITDKGEMTYNQIVNDKAKHKSQNQEVQTLTESKAKLENELLIAKRKIERLLEEKNQEESTPKLEKMKSNENLKSSMIKEEEEEKKLNLIEKYQSLLSIKQEENLGLIQRLESLEKHLNSLSSLPHYYQESHQTQTKTRNKVWIKRGGREEGEGGSFSSSVGSNLPLWVTTDQRSITSNSSSLSKGRIGNMNKEMQEILGLKVLLNQSDEDRVKVEIENRELKQEIEELKNTNLMLEGSIENPKKILKDYDKTVRLEKEIRNLKRENENLNRKHIQKVDALNQEVVELESIIESKVLKEAEIEAELQHYKYNS